MTILMSTTLILVALVVWSILMTQRGRPVEVRPLAPLKDLSRAIDVAVTAGRPVFFVPGTRDLDSMQTVAGLSLLEQVAHMCAVSGAELIVPVNRSLVMDVARERCRAAYTAAGRLDDWDDERVDYISDDPLGFVARVDGMISRQRPGACFFFGFFASESLLLAEGGYHVGAIQIAGTASPVQLPFFVAACDQTLIGEELFAAGASLSGDAALLGSLEGQDLGKWLILLALLTGTILATLAAAGWGPAMSIWSSFLEWFPEG
jgi:hypothetical protein